MVVNTSPPANEPSVSAGGPYTINAGQSLTLTATADGSPTTAEWDLLGNQTYSSDPSASFVSNGNGTSTATLTLTWAQLETDGILDTTYWASNGVGTFSDVTVRALYPTSQVAAGYLTSPSTTLTVNDLAPTATFSGTATAGGTGSVTFSNQASFVQTSGFLYSYDVGNTGTFQATNGTSPTYTIPASDLYQPGTLVVRGQITDEYGLSSDYIINVTIADQPPKILTIDSDKTVNINAGVALNDVTFSDPEETVVTASINWGDGTTRTPTSPRARSPPRTRVPSRPRAAYRGPTSTPRRGPTR